MCTKKKYIRIIIIGALFLLADLNSDDLSVSLAPTREQGNCKLVGVEMTEASIKESPMKIRWVPFVVVLHNKGSESIMIYNDDNSFGYDSLHLEIKKGGDIIKIEKKDKLFYRNLLAWTTIHPNSFLIIPFIVDNTIWHNTSFLKEKEVVIRAVFNQNKLPPNIISLEKDIYKKDFKYWEGKIESKWYSFNGKEFWATGSVLEGNGAMMGK
jgi:hypothetical protein